MLKKSLIAVVVLVAGLFVLGFLLPAEQLVGRSVTINAPPDAIYAHVDNLKSWTWAPWSATKMPGGRYRYDGPEAGVGARVAWQDEKVGDGKLWLTQADPTRGITYEMSVDGDQHKANGAVRFVPSGPATLVTWTSMARYGDPIARFMGIVAGERLGEQFEQGLLELKKIAEASAAARSPAPAPVLVEGGHDDVTAAPVAALPEPVEAPTPVEPEADAEAVARGAPAPPSAPEPAATPTQP
jgi:hypothetical protein